MSVKTLAAALAALVIGAGPTLAQGMPAPAPAAEGWRFALTPYFWAAGADGSFSTPRRSRDFDVSFDDIWSDLKFAFMGTAEVRYGRFGVLVDAFYLDVEDGVAVPRGVAFSGGSGRLESTQLAVVGMFRAVEDARGFVDIGAGLRAWWIDSKVNLTPNVLPAASFGASTNWVDPLVAIRASLRLSERFSLTAYGDVGGFDTGTKLTWQALGAAEYAFTPGIVGQLGYRYLYVDRERDNLTVDMAFGGPFIGLTFRF
jgi:hypothetical protein